MKKNKKKTFLFLLLILIFTCSFAQTNNYIVDKVKPGETLSSIAEKYKLSKLQIIKANPNLGRSLPVGYDLTIPIEKPQPEPEPQPKPKPEAKPQPKIIPTEPQPVLKNQLIEKTLAENKSNIRKLHREIALLKSSSKPVDQPATASDNTQTEKKLAEFELQIKEIQDEILKINLMKKTLSENLQSSISKPEQKSEPENDASEIVSGVNWVGFADIVHTFGPGEGLIAPGQIEIDLETSLTDEIDVALALAYGDDVFGSGLMIVDFHLFGSEGSHFRSIEGIDHSGIIIGQFDVPFGIDWHVYPSIDRKLVSVPLAVENLHDLWNDWGAQAYLEKDWLNAVVFSTNGFGYEDTSGNVVDMERAIGGRMGLSTAELIEIGGSYSAFLNKDYKTDMTMLGADIQLNYKNIAVKGEYITKSTGLLNENKMTNSGLYLQGLYDFGNCFVMGRYDEFKPDGADETESRICFGGG